MKLDERFIEYIRDRAREFERTFDRGDIENGWRNHSEFLKRYPFREHPELIDKLTPDKVQKKGGEDYFFLWVDYRTKALGALPGYSAFAYYNAAENIEEFKKLLRIVVDDSKSLSEKIDASWDRIKGFGGEDRIYAKKIIFLYYPKNVIPIFKNDHLEYFIEKLGLKEEVRKRSEKKYRKSYESLTIGEKYEILNEILLEFKNSMDVLKDWDNAYFMRFLYEIFPIGKIRLKSRELKPIISEGMLFSPTDELGVACLFSMFHKELGFPYIVGVSSRSFPDIVAIDERGNPVRIELEYRASDFIVHEHPVEDCDYIVCWENDLNKEMLEKLPKVISLKVEVKRILSTQVSKE